MFAVLTESIIPVFALLFFAITFATVFTIKEKRDATRRMAMEALSNGLGASYSAKDAFGLLHQLKQFDLFSRERTRIFRNGKITNVMRSMVGETEVFMFDYAYVVSTGKTTRKISQTVFFANDKSWYLPNFCLKPESWWHKLGRKLGMEADIHFEENPEFSEKFWVKSDFEDIIRRQFTPDLQAFMMERPPVHLEGDNYYLLAYKPGKLLDADESRLFFENCCALTKLLQTEGKLELLELVELKKEVVEITTDKKVL